MKKILCILSTLLSISCLQSDIVEISEMKEIHSYIKPDTLVIFDLDNTLIEPTQELGSDQWFYHQFESYLESGMLLKKALRKAIDEWHAIQNLTEVKIVEAGSEQIIENLQNQGLTIIGLTTRGLGILDRTTNQLEGLKINLAITAPTKENIFFNNPRAVLFHQGVLYTSATHKGTALFKFLKQIDYTPSHVVFINDKASHLKDIEETCAEKNIPFVGLRYGYLDVKVKNFQKDVAEIQFQQIKKLMNDEEALQLLQNK